MDGTDGEGLQELAPWVGSLGLAPGVDSLGAMAGCPSSHIIVTDSTTHAGNGSKSKAAAAQATLATPATGIAAISHAEKAEHYRNFGPAYVGTGVVGDLCLEVGISTGSGDEQQRSGIGIYLRSDHVAHRYASQLLI